VRRHLIVVLLVVVVISGAVAAGVLWNRPPGDLAGQWIATSVELDGASVLEPTDSALPTLTIKDEGDLSASITAGCNTIGGRLNYHTGGGLSFDDELITTDIGCPDRLAELESALADGLRGVDHVEVGDDDLVLTGDGVRMAFTRLTA
jgi:heat shock protein HslJ